MRRLALIPLLAALAACPRYDRYGYVATEKGLMAPDEYAKFGPEQAIAMAIGREFAQAAGSHDAAGYAKQADAAMTYGRKFPQVQKITADTLGHRLVVTFNDGWAAQVNPVTDGKRGDETANLPKAK